MEDALMTGFTKLEWVSLGGACEGANVPGGVVMVVSLQGGKGTRVRSGLACSMTFVPNVAVVKIGLEVGLVSTLEGQVESLGAMVDRIMKRRGGR